jgi:deazaflavin-dependent oxidoreductase (nitroreductase family)
MPNQQEERNPFVNRGWRKLFLRFPLYFWRMGLEPILRRFRFLVLTTRGRKSGKARTVMVEHSHLNGHLYIAPGRGEHRQWYQNVLADPHVAVQHNGETFGAVARIVAEAAELTALYHTRKNSPG